jgi:hypothetical protein
MTTGNLMMPVRYFSEFWRQGFIMLNGCTGFAVRGGDGGTPPPFMPGNAGFLYAGMSEICHYDVHNLK